MWVNQNASFAWTCRGNLLWFRVVTCVSARGAKTIIQVARYVAAPSTKRCVCTYEARARTGTYVEATSQDIARRPARTARTYREFMRACRFAGIGSMRANCGRRARKKHLRTYVRNVRTYVRNPSLPIPRVPGVPNVKVLPVRSVIRCASCARPANSANLRTALYVRTYHIRQIRLHAVTYVRTHALMYVRT